MPSAACPRCAEPVRLPAGDSAVTVRCPWCRETFRLGEVLDALPPMLEVVADDDVDPYSAEAPLVFDEGSIDHSTSAASPSAAATFDPGRLAETSVRSSPRRSPRSSPVVSFLKVAGGGIAGILIALAILQYLDRLPDLGFWPFRGPAAERVAVNSRLPYQQPRPEQARPEQARLEQARLEQARPEQARPEQARPDATPPNAASGDNGSGPPPADLPLPEFANDADRSPLSQSIEQAQVALANYHAASAGADDASGRLRPVVEALATIGEELAENTSTADEERQQIDALVRSLATDQRLLKQLLRAAAENLEAADPQSTTGIFAIGQLSTDGAEYHLKKSTRDPQPLRMLVDDESEVEVPAEGAIVIALGTVDESSGEKAIRAAYIASLVQRK